VARRLYEDEQIRAEFFFDPIEDIEPDLSGMYRYSTTIRSSSASSPVL
jgi:hypothetical protein